MEILTNIDWKDNTPILSSPKDMSAIPITVSYSFSLAENMQSLKTLLLKEFPNLYDKITLDII